MKKYDYVIWDFNGTLLDDVRTGIDSVNELLRDRGLCEIESEEKYREVFRFPIIEYYRSLGFDFEAEPYEVLAPLWVELYLENVKRAVLYPDVLDTLREVALSGVKQAVLSATERQMLLSQIADLRISEFFEEIMGLDNIHAGSKLALAYDWRARHPLARVLFVGDTDHDSQTAKALGADCVLVCRGHQSKQHLIATGERVEDDLGAVLEMIR